MPHTISSTQTRAPPPHNAANFSENIMRFAMTPYVYTDAYDCPEKRHPHTIHASSG